MQAVQVILPRTNKYHNIVQISFENHLIYKPTERYWCVPEAKRHVTPLPVSLRSHEPSQVNMFRGNWYLKYVLVMFNFVMNTASPNQSNRTSTRVIGNGSRTV